MTVIQRVMFLPLSPALFGKEHRPRRRAFGAAPSRSRLTAGCCRSRFVVANYILESPSSSKAAATAGFAEGKTATSCASVSEHQRYLRSFLMGLELWKYIVIQFRSKARKKKKFNRGSVSVSSRNLSCRRRGQQGRPQQNQLRLQTKSARLDVRSSSELQKDLPVR